MREEFKDIEIGGRKWRIKKFNAMVGSFMLFKVMGIVGPLFKGISITEGKAPDINFTEMLSGLTSLTEKDFMEIQTKCLKICFEVLPAGETQVLNDNGFGVIGLETDTATVLALTVHALIFNVQGFFGESLLSLIPKGIMPSSQQNTPT